MKIIVFNKFVAASMLCALAMFSSQPLIAKQNPDDGRKGAGKMQPQNMPSIVGKWTYKDAQIEIVTEFRPDGTFHEVDSGSGVSKSFDGQYRLTGQVLEFQTEGAYMQVSFVMNGPGSATLTYQNGRSGEFKRVEEVRQPPQQVRRNDSGDSVKTPPPSRAQRARSTAENGKTAASRPLKNILMQRVAEPNEGAFTVLVPKGWQISGGIFNISPMQTNGPMNSITPKCDFAIKADEAGTVMIRWIPTWNYADLSSTATAGLFQPGQYYKGMPVRYIVSPDQFLSQLMGTERPLARNVKVLGTDPMDKVTGAFQSKFAGVNQSLRQIGIAPVGFQSLAILVEYTENGVLFRETLFTTICDNRSGAFAWSNENTLMFRAPAESFAMWKPVLDMIRESLEFNPNWLASVRRNGDKRAGDALETQRYINKVNNEIAENHAKTNAEIAHEDWLMISGQEEYKNPYTGEVERGTSEYEHRWENNQGDVFYTSDNAFDPNTVEEYKSREWKKSEVWDRK